jgi:hypothetical protein
MRSEVENDNEKIVGEKADVTVTSSHQYRLKISDDISGFRQSKYNDSLLSDLNKVEQKPEGGCCPENKFWKQTKLMTWKNYLVFKRNYKQVLFQILVPISICILLIILQKIVDVYNGYFIDKDPVARTLEKLHKCVAPEDCVTIGYGLIVSDLIIFREEIIKRMSLPMLL